MAFWVYVIRSNTTGKIYIGQTNNLKDRLKRHNRKLPSKKTSYTAKNKGSWKLVYKERLFTRSNATLREKQLKNYRGRKFIKESILGR